MKISDRQKTYLTEVLIVLSALLVGAALLSIDTTSLDKAYAEWMTR